jgi:hypothetical protein
MRVCYITLITVTHSICVFFYQHQHNTTAHMKNIKVKSGEVEFLSGEEHIRSERINVKIMAQITICALATIAFVMMAPAITVEPEWFKLISASIIAGGLVLIGLTELLTARGKAIEAAQVALATKITTVRFSPFRAAMLRLTDEEKVVKAAELAESLQGLINRQKSNLEKTHWIWVFASLVISAAAIYYGKMGGWHLIAVMAATAGFVLFRLLATRTRCRVLDTPALLHGLMTSTEVMKVLAKAPGIHVTMAWENYKNHPARLLALLELCRQKNQTDGEEFLREMIGVKKGTPLNFGHLPPEFFLEGAEELVSRFEGTCFFEAPSFETPEKGAEYPSIEIKIVKTDELKTAPPFSEG